MNIFEKARWIWCPRAGEINAYADFPLCFEGGRGVRLRIAASGNYAAYVNGSLAAFGQYPGYDDMQFYDEVNLSSLCHEGQNDLLITAYNPGIDSSVCRKTKAGVIFELISDGEIALFSSENTLCRPSPIYTSGDSVEKITGQLGFGFALDLTVPGLPALPADTVERSYELLPRPIKKLELLPRVASHLIRRGGFSDVGSGGTPAEVISRALLSEERCDISLPSDEGYELRSDSDGIYLLFDLGREEAGILSLDIELPATADVIMGYGEHIADGRVRTRIGTRNFAAKMRLGGGRTELLQPFLRLGLRYLSLHIYAPSCRIYYAGVMPTEYPLGAPTPPPTDDTLRRRIYDVSLRTLSLCMHEHYEDCPWREQALYTMDSRNQMLAGYYAFGELDFARASIALMAHSLRDDAMLELCSPARVPITIPAFSAVFPLELYEHYAHGGDASFVRSMLPTVEAIVRGFLLRTRADGLLSIIDGGEYWNFYEWQSGLDGYFKKGERPSGRLDAPLCGFVALGYRAALSLFSELSPKSELIPALRNALARMAEGIEAFWCESEGAYASFIESGAPYHFSELTNSLLLLSELIPEERAERLRPALMSEKLIPITLSHSIFKYDALLGTPEGKNYVLSDIDRRFGHMLELGATSFWETEDGETAFNRAGSLCHGWSAIPAYIYFKL